jgi:NitT/TauT family transport system substrate-binding protein
MTNLTQNRPTRRRALQGMGAAFGALAMPARISAQGRDKLSFQTDWRAQAEHGGFYYAKAAGLYEAKGIDLDLRMGGPQMHPSQVLLGGKVDMVMSSGFQAIHFVKEKLPFLCIGTVFQKDPTCLISHPNVGNDSLAALKGKPILLGAASRTNLWPFLKAKYGYTEDQIRPYTFNMAPFLADKTVTQQGFVTSEPFAIEQAGVKPVIHLLADNGYDNYSQTIDISRKLATEKKDAVQRFMDATFEGWDGYLKRGPFYKAANELILKDNPEMDLVKIEFAVDMMNRNGLVLSGDAETLGLGAMTDARWQRLYEQMAAIGVFDKGLDVKQAYSLEFVNKGIGKKT